jgi:Lrp/AsnC family leucine-responsive transcriptional regulator
MAKNIVDETDLRILEELDKNIRSGSQYIGKKLGLRRQVVDYRIRKLEHNGAIAGYRMLPNLSKLGQFYYRVHIKLRSITELKKKKILDYLLDHKKVVWLSEADGVYNLLVGFVSPTRKEFQDNLFSFIEKFGEYITYYDFIDGLELAIPTRDFIGKKNLRPVKGWILGDFKVEIISEIDKKIISEIALDGAQTSLAIARKIKEPAEKVNYHLKKILQKGLMFSNIKFGYPVFGFELYKTLLYLKKPSRKRIEQLKKFARTYTRIWDYVETIGKWQFELDIESKGHEDYYEIMDAVQNEFSDILSHYETLFVREERKFSFDVFR